MSDGIQRPTPGGEIVLYQTEDGKTRVQCRFAEGTIWLTQAQIADLFQTTPQNITLHLKAIFAEGELPEEATCKDYLQVRQEGTRAVSRSLRHYRLEVVLAVGYRVRSPRGTQFRQWATARLQEYLVKGFVMDFLGGKPFSCLTARAFPPIFTLTIPARPLNNAQIGGLLISRGIA